MMEQEYAIDEEAKMAFFEKIEITEDEVKDLIGKQVMGVSQWHIVFEEFRLRYEKAGVHLQKALDLLEGKGKYLAPSKLSKGNILDLKWFATFEMPKIGYGDPPVAIRKSLSQVKEVRNELQEIGKAMKRNPAKPSTTRKLKHFFGPGLERDSATIIVHDILQERGMSKIGYHAALILHYLGYESLAPQRTTRADSAVNRFWTRYYQTKKNEQSGV
jgi:hypothetical protein